MYYAPVALVDEFTCLVSVQKMAIIVRNSALFNSWIARMRKSEL